MTSERFSLPATPVPDDALLNEVMQRSHIILVRYANRYAAITNDPMHEAEDYYQHISILLMNHVANDREAAGAMLKGDKNYLERFVSTLCQRRMRDLWETTKAERRNASRTVQASGYSLDANEFNGNGHQESLLENLVFAHGPQLDPDSAERVSNYCDGLPPLARRVVEVLLWPPTKLQESFLAARTKKSYGAVQIVAPERRYGHSRMDLKPREGYGTMFWTVDWEGPLRHGVIQTSHGDMTVSDETDLWMLEFDFPLLVLTDGQTGEFEHLTVRPSAACFDLKSLARYLSKETGKRIHDQEVRRAWMEAKARYAALFGGDQDRTPEPTPKRRPAAKVA